MTQPNSPLRRLVTTSLAAASLAIGSAAMAADPPDFSIEFPAGVACSNFALKVDLWEGKGRVRELKDKNGNLRSLFAGTGSAFRFTNTLNSKSTSTRNNGASSMTTTYTLDGSQKIDIHGHVLIIWFPSDIPAGPFTSYHIGHLVYNLSPVGVGTLVSMDGNSTDICAALS